MASLLGICFAPGDTASCAAFAQKLSIPFDLLCLSGKCPQDLGAQIAFEAELAELPPADALAADLLPHCSQYSHIVAVSSMASKDVMARLAGLLDAAMITDAVTALSTTTFVRPIVAGTVLATVEALTEPLVITFRPAAFGQPALSGTSKVEQLSFGSQSLCTRVSATARGGARPDLTQAKVVVSGGRPLGDADTFESVIGGLADALGGAVGATRAAVDTGIAPNELQVGQTGKIVAPNLYIAAGISGSTQHMAGIKDSKIIVAINKDPDAPIFEFADIGLVADLFEAIPEIRSKL